MSDEQMSLEGILSDEKPAPRVVEQTQVEAPKEPPPEEAKAAEKPQVEQKQSKKKAWRDREQDAQGRVRDPETGQYLPKNVPQETKPEINSEPAKEEPKAEPAKTEPAKAPVQEFTEKEKAFLRAAQEERNKRQVLERQMAELQAKVPQEPPKTFWDDPEAALKATEARVRAETTNARLGMAEYHARQKHPDFDEKVAVFAQLIQQTPGLHQQWLSAPDPAEYAYSLAKNHMELQQVGSMEEYRAKIERDTEARVRAKVEAEFKAKQEELSKARAELAPSLSQARSTGSTSRLAWGGPTPLESILSDK